METNENESIQEINEKKRNYNAELNINIITLIERIKAGLVEVPPIKIGSQDIDIFDKQKMCGETGVLYMIVLSELKKYKRIIIKIPGITAVAHSPNLIKRGFVDVYQLWTTLLSTCLVDFLENYFGIKVAVIVETVDMDQEDPAKIPGFKIEVIYQGKAR